MRRSTYERAALRWLERYLSESSPTLTRFGVSGREASGQGRRLEVRNGGRSARGGVAAATTSPSSPRSGTNGASTSADQSQCSATLRGSPYPHRGRRITSNAGSPRGRLGHASGSRGGSRRLDDLGAGAANSARTSFKTGSGAMRAPPPSEQYRPAAGSSFPVRKDAVSDQDLRALDIACAIDRFRRTGAATWRSAAPAAIAAFPPQSRLLLLLVPVRRSIPSAPHDEHEQDDPRRQRDGYRADDDPRKYRPRSDARLSRDGCRGINSYRLAIQPLRPILGTGLVAH